MAEVKIIVEMTPFIFEDGNVYYFNIQKRSFSGEYHNLYVYEKIITEIKRETWFGLGKTEISTKEEYKVINESPELVNTTIKVDEIKRTIKNIIKSSKVVSKIEGWDGFVGDIPNDVKTATIREHKLNNLLK